MEDYSKLNKDALIKKLEELEASDVATAIQQRDAALAAHAEATNKVTNLEAKLAASLSAEDKAEMDRQLQDLSDRLAANEATKGDPRPVVKVGEELLIIVPKQVNIDGVVVTNEQLAKRPDLLKRMRDGKSHALRNVKDIQAEKATAKK
jgi:hypothetical protein